MSENWIEKILEQYERYLAPIMFVGGFVIDNLTFKRIDLWFDHLVILTYLAVAGLGIIFINIHESGKFHGHRTALFASFVPFFIQFSFGGLFSAFVVVYLQSTSLATEWLFLFILAVLFIGNERFRHRYSNMTFQLSIYFIVIFSYSIFIVPVLVGKIGAEIFLLSGLVSLVFAVSMGTLLFYLVPRRFKENMSMLAISVGGIYLVFNILYFLNIIPPLPLALKEGGMYHSISRTPTNEYSVTFESAPWYYLFAKTSPVFHWKRGTPIYSFSAVFAPTKLNTVILHRWSYYDETMRGWVEKDRLPFPIFGGRDGGFRGYTFKYDVSPGKWRVDIITDRGQVLGRTVFTIVETETLPEFKAEEL